MINKVICYITMVVILSFLFVFYHNYQMFLMLITFILLLIASIIIKNYIYKKLEISIDIDQNMVNRNTQNLVSVEIENKTIFPIIELIVEVTIKNGFYEQYETKFIKASILPRKKEVATWDISSKNCGKISVEINKIRMFDYFKISKLEKVMDKATDFIVMPTNNGIKIDVDSLFSNAENSEFTKNLIGEETSEINNIREYRAGDRLQRIHWKLSAKQDEFMVKEYAISVTKKISILIELYNGEAKVLNEILDTFYSLAYALVKAEKNFSVCMYRDDTTGFEKISVLSESDIINAITKMYYMRGFNDKKKAYNYYVKQENKSEKYTTIYIGCKEKNKNCKGIDITDMTGKKEEKVVSVCIL